MIDINLTLVLQLGNFLIAYMLIDALIMSPVTKLLEENEEVINRLTKEYQHAQQELIATEESKQQAWIDTQKQFAMLIPAPPLVSPLIHPEIQLLPDSSPAQIEAQVKRIYTLFAERIAHA